MADNSKRTITTHDSDEIHTYLKFAYYFMSEIYKRDCSNYRLLEGVNIFELSSEQKSFILNHNLDIDPSVTEKHYFRIRMESCIIDFSTALTDTMEHSKVQRFQFPEKVLIYYLRRHMRISPSKEFPVEARFPSKSRLSKCGVENISAGGIAVKVPEAEGLFEVGEILDEVELLIPDNGKVVVSGQIRFTRGDRCGIKFLEINHRIEKMIEEYIDHRQMIERARKRSYKNIDEELLLFKKRH